MRIRCPQCGSGYEATAEGRQGCPSCGRSLFVPAGYAVTVLQGTSGYNPGTDFDAVLDQAEKEGWEAAVRNRKDLAEWTLAAERADGLYLTRLGRESVVLDYGCGFGNLSIAAAAAAKEVVALDAAGAFIRGTAIRAQQAGIANVLPVQSDYLNLPFFDETFDLVIVNGVLEYIPCQRPDRPPMETVRAFIAALTRVLKPGGQFYLAIENRFGINYLLGGKDEHSGLRFATVLPRPLADLYSRFASKRPYLTWTHSYRALRRLFAEAGYAHARVYAAFPDYRFPAHLVSLADSHPLDFFVRRSSRAAGSLKRRMAISAARAAARAGITKLPLWKALVPCFACVFTRALDESGARPAWLDRQDTSPVEVYLKSSRGNLSALLFERGAPRPHTVVRFTDTSKAAATEAALLDHFEGRRSRAVDRWVLYPYARTDSPRGKVLYYRWQPSRGRKPARADAEAFVEALSTVELPLFLDTDAHDRFVAGKLGELGGSGPRLAARYQAWVDRCGKESRFRIVHGDLHAGNFVWTGGGFAVIDWEYAHRGSPCEDLLLFAAWGGPRGSAVRFTRAARAAADGFGGLAARLRLDREDIAAGLMAVGLRLVLEARLTEDQLDEALARFDRRAYAR